MWGGDIAAPQRRGRLLVAPARNTKNPKPAKMVDSGLKRLLKVTLQWLTLTCSRFMMENVLHCSSPERTWPPHERYPDQPSLSVFTRGPLRAGAALDRLESR